MENTRKMTKIYTANRLSIHGNTEACARLSPHPKIMTKKLFTT